MLREQANNQIAAVRQHLPIGGIQPDVVGGLYQFCDPRFETSHFHCASIILQARAKAYRQPIRSHNLVI